MDETEFKAKMAEGGECMSRVAEIKERLTRGRGVLLPSSVIESGIDQIAEPATVRR